MNVEGDMCSNAWTHRPDAVSTAALSGRNFLCSSHYELARQIHEQRESQVVPPAPDAPSVEMIAPAVLDKPTSRRVEPTERPCAKCGTLFAAKRLDARYCTPRCRQAALRRIGRVRQLPTAAVNPIASQEPAVGAA